MPERIKIMAVVAYASTTKHPEVAPAQEAARALVLGVKDCRAAAVHDAVRMLSEHPGLRRFRGVVVPVPRSSSSRPKCLALSEALVRASVGSSVADVLERRFAVESSRERRRVGRAAVDCREHAESMIVHGKPQTVPVLLVDDLYAEGNTFCGAALALREAGWRGPIMAAAVGWDAGKPTRGNPFEPVTFTRELR